MSTSSKFIIKSFGHETTKPSDYSEMERVALIGTKAIEDATTDKTKFSAGQSSTMLCTYFESKIIKY